MGATFNKEGLAQVLAGMDDSPEAREAIGRLQASDLAKIDRLILSSLDRTWKKAGFVTAGVLIAAPDEYEEIPEAYYASRVRALAEASRIEVKGDLETLKTCQIRLSSTPETV